MKKPEIFFRPIGDSGPLSVYWYSGPYGDANEATSGNGVAWSAPNGELLGVEFDDVNVKSDHQLLELPKGITIEIKVNSGRVSVNLSMKNRIRHKKAKTLA